MVNPQQHIQHGYRALILKGWRYFFFLCMVAGVTSCASKKNLTGSATPAATPEMNVMAEKMMDKISSTQVPYTWFSGSGQGRIDWDGQRLSARFNVRILRDSIIWVQLSKLGFEVGRMLITPDSAFFINRFEHTYGRYKTEDFLREYGVPVDFNMFSSVFTAGAYMPPKMRISNQEMDGSIQGIGDSGVKARYWFDASAVLIRSLIIDPLAREWSSGFSDYKKVGSGHQLPFKRSNTLLIDGKPNVFDLEYTSLELDIPQSFPFSIPSHYEKI